jgi:CheY-like chemotaxis protein
MNKILVVDDEPGIRRVLKTILSIKGFDVIEAVDGVKALEALKKYSFDLIITDIQMPNADGFEVVEEASDTPIIVMSANSMLLDCMCKYPQVKARILKGIDFITKIENDPLILG